MIRAKNLAVVTVLSVVAVAGVLVACGGGGASTGPANDTTTVSIEKPGDSAMPASSAAPPAK